MIHNRNASLDELVESAIAPVVERVAATIAKHIAQLTARQLEAELSRTTQRTARETPASPSRRRRSAEMTKWVADNRARRVPNFVIEMTGLDTKKKIVAKYGAGAVFDKGKPLPSEANATVASREVKAKPPIVRRKNAKTAA